MNPADERGYFEFRFTEGERRVFRRREKLTVSQWAEKYRIVEKGPMPGRWRNDVTPYLVEPMDCWNLPWIRKIILQFAPQTGKTQVVFNCLCFAADQDPGSFMYVMPDEKVAKRIMRKRILPMLRRTPRIAGILCRRLGDQTSMTVNFTNGMDLMMSWATSAAELSSESIRYLAEDEVDKYPDFSGKEADPISLAEIRTNAYPHTKKIIITSTPTVEGSPIHNAMEREADEIRRYHVPCPVCGEFQIMDFDRIRWPADIRDPRIIRRRKLAVYECVFCGMSWDDHRRDLAVRAGQWRADRVVERPRAVGFHLPSWYSPFISLSDVAAAFLRGQEDRGKLMVFVTQHKAEAWKESIRPKDEGLLLETHRTAIPPLVVPAEAIALTAGIDSQKNGFWFVVRAWAEDLTSWLVQYGFLPTFRDVEDLVFHARYRTQQGEETMGIWRAGIDTAGGETEGGLWTRTEEVYQWLRKIPPGRVFGMKGASRRQHRRIQLSTIDRMPRSNRPIPGGLELRLLDTAQFKSLIHWRLDRSMRCQACGETVRGVPCDLCGGPVQPESQRFYLHAETGADYVRQLLAEELRVDRRGRREWVPIRRDNHYLDCEVMAAACADSEWLPNLQMMAVHLRRMKIRDTGEETAERKGGWINPPRRSWVGG